MRSQSFDLLLTCCLLSTDIGLKASRISTAFFVKMDFFVADEVDRGLLAAFFQRSLSISSSESSSDSNVAAFRFLTDEVVGVGE
jgi:hypothetical protein